MARTAVTVTDLAALSSTLTPSVTDPTGTTADPTNGHTVTGVRPEVLVFRVSNTTAGALNAILRAGTQPLAPSSGQGDLTVSVPANSTVWIGPAESARFLQPDGSVSLDLGTGFAGKVTAFKVNHR
jgi:hypothetical protein